jgi:hypothetical protein
MQSNAARIAVLIAAIAIAVVLFVVLSDDDGGGDEATTVATAPTPTATTEASSAEVIRVRNGEPFGGVHRLDYERGNEVRLEVQLDRPAEEVHIHGYDITESAASSPVRVSFEADIDGLFEVEVHSHEFGDVPIAELRINP